MRAIPNGRTSKTGQRQGRGSARSTPSFGNGLEHVPQDALRVSLLRRPVAAAATAPHAHDVARHQIGRALRSEVALDAVADQHVLGDARITASIVPAEQRMDFLPNHFGARAMIKFEMSVYDWMGSLCPTYRGGFWNYVELSNGGAFMYPAGVDAFEFTVDGNGSHGTVSAEVAGISATACALNGMLWQGWDSLNTQYELLLEFIGDRPDAMTIRRALD